MGYRGMVVINNDEFGESMELVHCIKKAACKLVEKLSEAQMAERHNDEYDEYDDEDMEYQHRMSGKVAGKTGHHMPRGRYGY